MKKIKVLLLTYLLIFCGSVIAADDFLSPEEAFNVTWEKRNDDIKIEVNVAQGYYIYKSSISAKDADGSLVTNLVLPKPVAVYDKVFSKTLEVYPSTFVLEIQPIKDAKQLTYVELTYQGCAKEGLCYPPQTKQIRLERNSVGKVVSDSTPSSQENQLLTSNTDISDETFIQNILKSQNLWKVALSFIIFGVLLSFTPCVLPMVPILSSIIIGGLGSIGENSNKYKPIIMAVS